MTKSAKTILVSAQQLERKIFIIRGQRVMLDSDLAKLYGVPVKRLNEQVQRNKDRFPGDFAFQLTQNEYADLKSQIATSSSGHGGKRKLPWVFTEHGVAMLSSVLRSPRAVQVNIEIVRAFVRLRRLLATPGELVAQLNELAETVQLHDHQIKQIADVLRRMMEPPKDNTPRRRIGFTSSELRASQDGSNHEPKGVKR